MGDQEESLDEFFRLTHEQAEALGRILSDEDSAKFRSRAQRIEELLEQVKQDDRCKI